MIDALRCPTQTLQDLAKWTIERIADEDDIYYDGVRSMDRLRAVHLLKDIENPLTEEGLIDPLEDATRSLQYLARWTIERSGDVETFDKVVQFPANEIYDSPLYYSLRELSFTLTVRKEKTPNIPLYPELLNE